MNQTQPIQFKQSQLQNYFNNQNQYGGLSEKRNSKRTGGRSSSKQDNYQSQISTSNNNSFSEKFTPEKYRVNTNSAESNQFSTNPYLQTQIISKSKQGLVTGMSSSKKHKQS